MSSVSTITPVLPRKITDGFIWTGGCLAFEYDGEDIHGHMCTYLLKGTERTLLVDGGHPAHWSSVERTLDEHLDGRPLDYVFPTHSEMPHAGNLERLLNKYPDLQVVGDVRDYHLFFPGITHRFLPKKAGESVDLGGREVQFLEAIWRDLPNSLWAYDTGDKVLFPADGFAYTHSHTSGQCALISDERPAPDHKQTIFINERALFWTRYVGVERSFKLIDEMFERYPAEMIAPAHGSVITSLESMVPLLKQGMISMKNSREDGSREVVGY